MFKDKYKQEMDKIKPSEDAINNVLFARNIPPKRNGISKRMVMIAIISTLIFSIIASLFIGALNPNIINDKHLNDTSEDESNPDYANNNDIPFSEPNGIHKAKSYKDIQQSLKQALNNRNEIYEEEITEDSIMPVPPTLNSPSTDGIVDEEPDHSDTNNQVSGVQESDVVKNDGKYIYYYSNAKDKLYIIETSNGNMTEASVIDVSDTAVISMFLLNDELAVIGYRKNASSDIKVHPKDYNYSSNKTNCDYYDISDKNNPKLIKSTSQDGYYIDSRCVDNIVYIITKHYVSDYKDDFLPKCNNDQIAIDCVYIPDYINASAFTVITAFDTSSKDEGYKSTISILGGANTVYSGKENLYFTEYAPSKKYSKSSFSFSNTAIYRIALNNGKLLLSASGCIPGSVKDQFNIDEKDGILRIATNIQFYKETNNGEFVSFDFENTVNRVFCLNKSMEIIGESEDLGISENIKSVRYIGDMAYVVTFRQTDPLYAIDLSDPTNPKTLSELKINGFSTYMHPYGDNYMIGIGYDADPETGISTGLKVTIFDVSNQKDIIEVSSYILKWEQDENSTLYDSEATYNHKALLIDYNKGIIAIPLTETTYDFKTIYEQNYSYEVWTSYYKTSYVFLNFNGTELTEMAKTNISELIENNGYQSVNNIRGLYIGNYAYVIDNNKIISLSLETMDTIFQFDFE